MPVFFPTRFAEYSIFAIDFSYPSLYNESHAVYRHISVIPRSTGFPTFTWD